MLSYLYSCLLAKTSLIFSTVLAITDSVVLIIEGATVLKTALQGTAKMTMLPSYCIKAAGYALYPLLLAEQHSSCRPAYIAQARLEGEQPNA